MNSHNNHNEDEDIRGLLDQVKQQGMPYSEEPDPLYWANFRVRVMERVQPERLSLFAKAKNWLWESGLRTSLVGGGLAALLFGGVYFGTQQDGQSGQIAVTTKTDKQVQTVDSAHGVTEQTPNAPEVVAPNSQQPEIAQTPEVVPPVIEQPKTLETMTESEIAAPLLAAESAGPATSLDEMTEQELQALLASVEEMN